MAKIFVSVFVLAVCVGGVFLLLMRNQGNGPCTGVHTAGPYRKPGNIQPAARPVPDPGPRPEALARSNGVAEASATFKSKPGARAREAGTLFALVTNGMPREQVVELLGQPEWTGTLASSSNRWTYSVVYNALLVVEFGDDRVVKTEAVGFDVVAPTGKP
jgi:hypothetical protein